MSDDTKTTKSPDIFYSAKEVDVKIKLDFNMNSIQLLTRMRVAIAPKIQFKAKKSSST